jgi:hypothetical protein
MDDPNQSIRTYIDGVAPDKRRRDARKLLDMMGQITGETPQLWTGSVIGFGQYHYRYATGREGDAPAAGFSPRRAAMSIYLPDGVGRYDEQLKQLGPHTTGVSCLYIKDLDMIDIAVLEAIVAQSYRTVTADTYTLRAREGAAASPDD